MGSRRAGELSAQTLSSCAMRSMPHFVRPRALRGAQLGAEELRLEKSRASWLSPRSAAPQLPGTQSNSFGACLGTEGKRGIGLWELRVLRAQSSRLGTDCMGLSRLMSSSQGAQGALKDGAEGGRGQGAENMRSFGAEMGRGLGAESLRTSGAEGLRSSGAEGQRGYHQHHHPMPQTHSTLSPSTLCPSAPQTLSPSGFGTMGAQPLEDPAKWQPPRRWLPPFRNPMMKEAEDYHENRVDYRHCLQYDLGSWPREPLPAYLEEKLARRLTRLAFTPEMLSVIATRIGEIPKSKIDPALHSARRAAVMLPLCNINGKPSVLLNLRSQHVGTHKGHVCFPGGHLDMTDECMETCASREVEEELGVRIEAPSDRRLWEQDWRERPYYPQSNILGRLPNCVAMTGTLVTPVVGFMGDLDLQVLHQTANRDEIEEVFAISIQDLLNPANIEYEPDFGCQNPCVTASWRKPQSKIARTLKLEPQLHEPACGLISKPNGLNANPKIERQDQETKTYSPTIRYDMLHMGENMPAFVSGKHRVWGLTAFMLHHFLMEVMLPSILTFRLSLDHSS